MVYQKHYNRLIKRAKNRILNGYTESHHIIPRCMGGDNSSKNLVQLTAREHYIAHLLLVKIYPNHDGLVWAAILMTRHNTDQRKNNRLYEWLRIKHSNNMKKKRTGKLNGSYGRYWYYCPISLDCGKYLPDEIPNGWLRGKKPKPKQIPKNKKYCYDPKNFRILEIKNDNEIPNEWIKGKPPRKNRWYHNPKSLQEIRWYPDEVEDGWVLGILKFMDKVKPKNKPKNKPKDSSGFKVDCVKCKFSFYAKWNKTSLCFICRKKKNNKVLILEKKDDIIRDYEKYGSLNKALKENGFPGAVGGYYTQAKKLIDEHYNNK